MTGRITVLAHDPFIMGNGFREDLSDRIISYTHMKGANKGCVSATITFNVHEYELDDWILNGLGRDIKVYSSNLALCNRVLVNTISVKAGPETITIGPLLDICNRCTAIFVPILDPTVNPPLLGNRTETLVANILPSQEQYGIIERIVNAGTTFNDADYGFNADDIRDLFLNEYQTPAIDRTFSFGSSSNLEITLECIGYSDLLKVYVYNNYSASNYIFLSTKVANILAAEPNGFLSSDMGGISANPMLTIDYEAENRFAMDLLEAIVAQGDASGNRWLFGVDQYLKAFYKTIPTEIKYYHMIVNGHTSLGLGPECIAVDPAEVEAGEWVYVPDLAVGSRYSATLARDARAAFIETVSFSFPNNLDITGGQVRTISQRLAQYGLGGV